VKHHASAVGGGFNSGEAQGVQGVIGEELTVVSDDAVIS
jgi:hypothetical protein